ncbi:MAG: hypothetical protein U5K51_14395 [Flavobacteriaceae bacterium]|nr:hypothetical protein [Flavobacteriaceae bacterium]
MKNGIRSVLVITMVIIYLFAPHHQPLFKELHRISHYLEGEFAELGSFFTHHHQETPYNQSHEHGFTQKGESLDVKSHDHTEEQHRHELLSFFSFVLGALEDQNPMEEAIVVKSLDKHILSQPDFQTAEVFEIFRKVVWFIQLKNYGLLTEIFLPPPQTFLPLNSAKFNF